MNARFCSQCGHQLQQGARFCGQCGGQVEQEPEVGNLRNQPQHVPASGEVVDMSQSPAAIHLRRAFGIVKKVGQKTEELRQHVVQYSASLQQDQQFLKGMVSAIAARRQVATKKATLKSDLDLAISELDKAQAAGPDEVIQVNGNDIQSYRLRAWALMLHGLVETFSGSSETARRYFWESIHTFDNADANFWMGVCYEEDFDPQNALLYYERCLTLDPDGEFSIEALRSANRMRNYKKRFRGSWVIFGLLCWFLFPMAIVYYFSKRR